MALFIWTFRDAVGAGIGAVVALSLLFVVIALGIDELRTWIKNRKDQRKNQ